MIGRLAWCAGLFLWVLTFTVAAQDVEAPAEASLKNAGLPEDGYEAVLATQFSEGKRVVPAGEPEESLPETLVAWFQSLRREPHWETSAAVAEQVSCPDSPTMECHLARTNLVGDAGAVLMYRMDVQSGMERLQVRLTGGDGDADLYVRHGQPPEPAAFDRRPFRQGNEEEVVLMHPQTGTWFFAVTGYMAFSNVTLSVQCGLPLEEDAEWDVRSASDLELAMYYELSGVLATPEDAAWSDELRYRALRDQGRTAFEAGDYDRAIESWQLWSELAPADGEPLSLIGDTYLRQGDLDEAIAYYRQSLDRAPGQFLLLVRLARLLDTQAGDPVASRELLNTYEWIFPGEPQVVLAKAEWLLRRRRYDEAGQLIQRVLQEDPADLRALTLRHRLLQTPQERLDNMREMLTVGQRPNNEMALARAISDNQLMGQPESWVLMPFVEQAAYHSRQQYVRNSFLPYVARSRPSYEDFRVGRITPCWTSSHQELWAEDGTLLLRADPQQTEAYLRLVRSDGLLNGFVEATVLYSRGHVWLYARRSEGNMIRFGFDSTGLMYQQVWVDGELRNNQSRLWSQAEGSATLRLEIRGDGVFTYVDGRPAFSTPLTIPRDMGLGWWGIAPWAPDPGRATVQIQKVAGGPLPVRIGLLDYARQRGPDGVANLQENVQSMTAMSPLWYAEIVDGRLLRLPYTEDTELRVLSRFARSRLMPILRVNDLNQLPWAAMQERAREDRIDGYTLLVDRMPTSDWTDIALANLLESGLSMHLILVEPDGQHALFMEITPGTGLFPGARRLHRLPLVNREDVWRRDAFESIIVKL
jgi:tetratricopeptide (TPR) repeat protein